jgi:hypothetical protein
MAGTYYSTTTEEKATKLFTFSVNNTDPLIKLVPKADGKIIDVVNDFAWSASPRLQDSFKKVPVMYLQEREQVVNSLLSSALYYINAMKQFDGTDAFDLNSLQTKLDKLATDGTSGISANTAGNIKEELKQIIANAKSSDNLILSDKLRSYLGIYLTEPTGFNYALPFFDETPLGVKSSWTSDSNIMQNPLSDMIDVGQGAMERIAHALNITQPGTFIEKPKYFQYNTGGESVSVSFPLFNTIKRTNKTSYQQNYELLWILAYQNKPYRTSFSRISPPKLYTLTIPGQKFMPYCYISDMNIKFGGTRRKLPVSIPLATSSAGEKKSVTVDFNTVEVSVPDVYMVQITFTSLLADVANTMVDSGFTSRKISVGTVNQ